MQEISFSTAHVIITTPERNLFYLQLKNGAHPILHLRGDYTLFGGSVEKGETAEEALERELLNELDPIAASTVIEEMKWFGNYHLDREDGVERLVLYKAALDKEELEDPAQFPIAGGAPFGILITKRQIIKTRILLHHQRALVEYLVS